MFILYELRLPPHLYRIKSTHIPWGFKHVFDSVKNSSLGFLFLTFILSATAQCKPLTTIEPFV
jgi:hypothetical protein